MAALDFMHKQLINAASKDALGSIGMGAGIGAGVGAANALITGNDSLLGGATSGAMLGAAGGAGMRYAGTKYGAGIAAQGSHGNKFDYTLFSKAEKPFNFMSNSEANSTAFNSAMKASPNAGAPQAAPAAAGNATAGSVNTSASKLPNGTDLAARRSRQAELNDTFRPQTGAEGRHADAQSTWNKKRDAMKATSAEREKARMAEGMAKDEKESQHLADFQNKLARDREFNQKMKSFDADKQTAKNLQVIGADDKPYYKQGQSQLEMFPSRVIGKAPTPVSLPNRQGNLDFSSPLQQQSFSFKGQVGTQGDLF